MAGYLQENQAAGRSKPVTAPALGAMRAAGQKITMLTCYDASFAALMDRCGVDMLLVGDSLGMVSQGHQSTLPVTIDDMAPVATSFPSFAACLTGLGADIERPS